MQAPVLKAILLNPSIRQRSLELILVVRLLDDVLDEVIGPRNLKANSNMLSGCPTPFMPSDREPITAI